MCTRAARDFATGSETVFGQEEAGRPAIRNLKAQRPMWETGALGPTTPSGNLAGGSHDAFRSGLAH